MMRPVKHSRILAMDLPGSMSRGVLPFCEPARSKREGSAFRLNCRCLATSADSVQPVFDGWQRNADGTVSMWFGYLNRNRKEIVDVPVGAANHFNLNADSGQPTHFLHAAAPIRVPKSRCPRIGTKTRR